MLSYITFPPGETIAQRLRVIHRSEQSSEPLFLAIAEHLGDRTLESAAFCFMLIELVHRHPGALDDKDEFVPRCVFALTGDRELSEVARAALKELGPTGPS